MKYEDTEFFVFPTSYVLHRISVFRSHLGKSPQNLTNAINLFP